MWLISRSLRNFPDKPILLHGPFSKIVFTWDFFISICLLNFFIPLGDCVEAVNICAIIHIHGQICFLELSAWYKVQQNKKNSVSSSLVWAPLQLLLALRSGEKLNGEWYIFLKNRWNICGSTVRWLWNSGLLDPWLWIHRYPTHLYRTRKVLRPFPTPQTAESWRKPPQLES